MTREVRGSCSAPLREASEGHRRKKTFSQYKSDGVPGRLCLHKLRSRFQEYVGKKGSFCHADLGMSVVLGRRAWGYS